MPWRLFLIVFICTAVPAACAPAQDLTPVIGRLTPLSGEGPPAGYIGGDIPERYQGLRDPFSVEDQDALARGQRVYLAGAGLLSCVFCHGGRGRGDGPMAYSVDPLPADFAAPPMLAAFRQHQDYVFWWVSEGVPKTVMPAYKDVLDDAQRWQVITYAWHLGEQTHEAGR